jgi:lysophospholipase L1-like esterase
MVVVAAMIGRAVSALGSAIAVGALLAGSVAAASGGAIAGTTDGLATRLVSREAACAVPQVPDVAQKPLPFGDARDFGAVPRGAPGDHREIVAMAVTPLGRGYWLVASGGRVFSFGRGRSHGSTAVGSNDRVVGIVATHDGRGYWLVTRRGRVFAFGDAHLHASDTGHRLASPIVALAATRDDRGYWLVAADGSVFNYGDARFYGSAATAHPRDVVAIVATPDGRGYWLAASSGGLLSYGDAHFYGSAISKHVHEQIVGLAATRDGRGYWLVAADGKVFNFGDAHSYGSASSSVAANTIVSIAASPNGRGYWLLPTVPRAGLPAPGKAFAACRVTAIGDSVMLDVQPALEADIPGIDVRATVSRQWDSGVAFAQQLKSEGVLGAIVVVGLGANGPVSWQQLTNMMNVLAGASRVVFVTVHLPSSYSWSASVNSTLAQGVARYPRARLADFNKLADENPQWFGADGVHMPVGGPGAQAMAALIKAEI